jgi:hypothetical protein
MLPPGALPTEQRKASRSGPAIRPADRHTGSGNLLPGHIPVHVYGGTPYPVIFFAGTKAPDSAISRIPAYYLISPATGNTVMAAFAARPS